MARKIDDLFASMRFVLPEQKELYLQHREDFKLVPKPILEEDELEAFQYLIRDSAQNDYAVTVTWWNRVKGDLGTTCCLWGVIKWVDPNTRRIKLVNDESAEWIHMDKIIDVRA